MTVLITEFLINPFIFLGILLTLIVILTYYEKRQLVKWISLATVIWYLLISTPLIPNYIICSLEDKYSPLNINELPLRDAEYDIIVLGGGHGFDSRLPANSLLSNMALSRLSEGIRLHNLLPNSRLILSGFSESGRTTQAEMLQKTALLLGVKEEAMLLQKEPANTYQEAEVYSANFASNHSVIVVTSAFHMPRAIEMFKAFGINAYASPSNYRVKGKQRYKWVGFPNVSHVQNLSTGISEYLKIWWYTG